MNVERVSDKFYREALAADCKPVKLRLSLIAREWLFSDPIAQSRSLTLTPSGAQWRGLSIVLDMPPITHLAPVGRGDASAVADEVYTEPMIITIEAHTKYGRTVYFNHPDNPEGFK